MEEFCAEKRKSTLLTWSVVVFVVTKWRVLASSVAFVWRSHISSSRLPKMLLHFFEEDTLPFLLVGKLWLKAVYQVVIFVSEICPFYVCQKSVK